MLSTRDWQVSLVALLASLLSLPTACRKSEKHEPRAARTERLKQERTKRQAGIAATAPAPRLPTSLPLKGPAGVDEDGYPTQYVDRLGLRTLLHHGRYNDLNRFFEEYQVAFEKDPRKEYWPIDASSTFSSAEPELREKLDAWVKATPRSFAPYLARGAHSVSVGYASRGHKWAHLTANEHMDAMAEAMKRALKDLDRALELRPKLVAAMRLKIQALVTAWPREQLQKVIERAIAVCRPCFQVRVTYIETLRPRWGGSYEEMRGFAEHRVDPDNRRHRLLPGYIDLDKAAILRKDKKYDEALKVVQRACALGNHWEFLLARADINRRAGRAASALEDITRAERLRPGLPQALFDRAWALMDLKRYEAAARALLAGMRIAPTDSSARQLHRSAVQGLLYEAGVLHKAGKHADTLRLLDLAAELAPTDRKVQHLRSWVIAGPAAATDMPALEAAVRANPDDFRAIQKLDFALVRQRRFDRSVELWNGYLARHPDDGPAYLERGGAYFHMRRLKEAGADAKKACELGVSEGCARARQVAGMTR